MTKIEPYWNPKGDMNDFRFSLRKEKRTDFIDVSDVPESVLPFYSFVYLTEGEILLEVEGMPYFCRSGQLLMIPRNIPFRVIHFKESGSYEGGFSLHTLKDASYACLHDPHPLFQRFSPEESEFTTLLLEQIYQAWQHKNCDIVASGIDFFLARLKPNEGHPGNPNVNLFLEHVFDRNRKPGKVADYADELCITPNYLNRLVRSQTGRSAMEWIEISRLNLAKSLLKQGDMQISEISEAVGIDDQSYFTRFFKKSEGFTPSQFREKAKKAEKLKK